MQLTTFSNASKGGSVVALQKGLGSEHWQDSSGHFLFSSPTVNFLGCWLLFFSLSGFLHLLRPLPAWLAILFLLLEGHWSVLSADLECLRASLLPTPALPCAFGAYSQSPSWLCVKTSLVARTLWNFNLDASRHAVIKSLTQFHLASLHLLL